MDTLKINTHTPDNQKEHVLKWSAFSNIVANTKNRNNKNQNCLPEASKRPISFWNGWGLAKT